ncbi:MAG: hypothetical protein OHK0046_28260 [Anaerolineae bacterium]
MKAFDELIQQDLKWVSKGSFKKNHELRTSDDEVVATMIQPSAWSNRVEVEAPGNRWSFERKGFWQQYILIQSVGTGSEPARFTYRKGGALEFPDGRVFHWKNNFWGNKWAWTTADDEPVIGFKTGGLLTLNGEVRVDEDSSDLKALPLLMFLGWYLINLYYQDAAATTTFVAAT